MSIVVAIALVLLFPADALAWGPGVHLALGNFFLTNLSYVAAPVAKVLAAHPEAFLYGSLSADIFIGKGLRARPGHSHDWVVGRELARATGGGALSAFGYGYLAHLAADVVAHNYFVPNQLAVAPLRGRMTHVLVEIQADARVDWSRSQAMRLFSRQWTRDADLALVKSLGKGLRPFLLKKKIFKESVSLAGRHEWGQLAREAGRVLPLPENEKHLARMLDASQALVAQMLRNPKDAVAYGFDPIGAQNQAAVRRMGRRIGGSRLAGFGRSGGSRARVRHARLLQSPPFPMDPEIADLRPPGNTRLMPSVARDERAV